MPETEKRYAAIKQDERVRAHVGELQKAGKTVFFLGGSDPVMGGFTNPRLKEALCEAAEKGLAMYPSSKPNLLPDLKEAICTWEKKYRSVDCTPEDLILTPGIAAGMSVVHYSLLDHDKEVLTLEPSHYYAQCSRYFYLFGARINECRCLEENEWQPDLDEIRKKINKTTVAIAMTYPNNPTGAVHEEKTLRQIVDLAGEHNIPVMTDEMYSLITFGSLEAKSMLRLANDVPAIVLNGMSKTFMCPGWRLGYVCIHDPRGKMSDLTKKMRIWSFLYGHATTAIPTPMLYAATKIYQGSIEPTLKMVKETQKRRDYTMKMLDEIRGVSCVRPRASLYAFPRFHGVGRVWKTEDEFLIQLLDEEGIGFLTGLAFGPSGFGHVRTLLQRDEKILHQVYSKLGAFLKRHKADI